MTIIEVPVVAFVIMAVCAAIGALVILIFGGVWLTYLFAVIVDKVEEKRDELQRNKQR